MSKPLRRAVKSIVDSQLETKRTNWYQDYRDGTVTTKDTGFFRTQGWAVQNNQIAINNTDILRLIPSVQQGTDDYERVGTRIRPVSLTVKGQIRIRLSFLNSSTVTVPQNLTVDLYVLQHVRLKDYNTLYGLNSFAQLLETGEGALVPYTGLASNSAMRVSEQNYKVLQRRRITLRYAGVINGVPSTTVQQVSMFQPQDHTFYAEYSMNLSKHLPAVLHYPEELEGTTPVSPVVTGAPTNSSIFMAIGYASWYNNSNAAAQGDAQSAIEQTYVSELGFKDA